MPLFLSISLSSLPVSAPDPLSLSLLLSPLSQYLSFCLFVCLSLPRCVCLFVYLSHPPLSLSTLSSLSYPVIQSKYFVFLPSLYPLTYLTHPPVSLSTCFTPSSSRISIRLFLSLFLPSLYPLVSLPLPPVSLSACFSPSSSRLSIPPDSVKILSRETYAWNWPEKSHQTSRSVRPHIYKILSLPLFFNL